MRPARQIPDRRRRLSLLLAIDEHARAGRRRADEQSPRRSHRSGVRRPASAFSLGGSGRAAARPERGRGAGARSGRWRDRIGVADRRFGKFTSGRYRGIGRLRRRGRGRRGCSRRRCDRRRPGSAAERIAAGKTEREADNQRGGQRAHQRPHRLARVIWSLESPRGIRLAGTSATAEATSRRLPGPQRLPPARAPVPARSPSRHSGAASAGRNSKSSGSPTA